MAFATLLLLALHVQGRGSDSLPALIPPLVEEVTKRCFGTFLQPKAEFRIVLAGDLDPDGPGVERKRCNDVAAVVRHRGTAPLR